MFVIACFAAKIAAASMSYTLESFVTPVKMGALAENIGDYILP